MARKKVVSSEGAVVAEDNSVLTDILVDSLNKEIGEVAYIMGKGESPAEVREWSVSYTHLTLPTNREV